MLIECLLKRAKGSFVEIDGTTYHFKPESGEFADPHVCNVENPEHAQRLLAIREGYIESYFVKQHGYRAKPGSKSALSTGDGVIPPAASVIDPDEGFTPNQTTAPDADPPKVDDTIERANVADLRARYRATFGSPAPKTMTRGEIEAALAAAPKGQE